MKTEYMETINREELDTLVGKPMFLIVSHGSLLRDEDNAFFAAVNEDEAAAFCERYAKDKPDDYDFSIYKYDVPNIAAFNTLYDSNYKGFQIVNMGFYVQTDELYEKRQSIVSKLINIYKGGGCLHVPLDEENRAIATPVDGVPVTISFFSDKERANEVAENGCGDHTIERWISNLPLDTILFSVDGELVYGWEVSEAVSAVWNEYIVTPSYLKDLLKDNKFHILKNEDTGEVLQCDGIPILFASKTAVEAFAKDRKGIMESNYTDCIVEEREELSSIIGSGQYAFVDTESGRFVGCVGDLEGLYDQKEE